MIHRRSCTITEKTPTRVLAIVKTDCETDGSSAALVNTAPEEVGSAPIRALTLGLAPLLCALVQTHLTTLAL